MRPVPVASPRRSGFTLIEVAIALAIFVIGALAIIKIFPGLLGVVQTSGEKVAAINMNRARLAEYDNNPGLVPDATYDDPAATSAWPSGGIQTGATVGSVRRNNAVPRDFLSYGTSAYGHFKHIRSEKARVSPSGQFIVLRNSSTGVYTVYEEDDFLGVTTDNDGNLNFRNARLASTGETITLDGSFLPTTPSSTTTDYRYDPLAPAPNDVIFYVTYRYRDAGGLWLVEDEPFFISSTQTGVQVQAGTYAGSNIVPGSVSVHMRRILQRSTAPDDSAQFVAGCIPKNTTAGECLWNDGQPVSVDYEVRDWRWIGVEGDLSRTFYVDDNNQNQDISGTPNLYVFDLPIRRVDDGFEGPGGTVPLYALMWNDTLAVPGSWSVGNTTGAVKKVEYRRGEVVLDRTILATNSRTRIVYRTLDNWAQQTNVAARSYLYYKAANEQVPEPWRYYAISGSNLYFKPSEAGKTVRVSYTIKVGTTDIQVRDRLVVIEDDLVSDATLPTEITDAGLASTVELTDLAGNTGTVESVQGLRGASIQVRSAWLNGDRFAETSLMGYRRDD